MRREELRPKLIERVIPRAVALRYVLRKRVKEDRRVPAERGVEPKLCLSRAETSLRIRPEEKVDPSQFHVRRIRCGASVSKRLARLASVV
ncbi:MAG TPA: hypothetical protein VF587_06035 [Solirubrobacteraceae bacterium]|jgi:hypothetical protein